MSIVRSLLISVGFVTDRKSITKTNKAIEGFKTRFSIAASAAAYAFSRVLNFFGDIASAVLDANDLAATLGISLNEMRALNEAASNFGFRNKKVSDALATVNNLIIKTKNGFGDLDKISNRLRINIDKNGTVTEVFTQILQGLSDIDNEQHRISEAAKIFGDNLGKAVSDLSQNIDKFRASAKELEKTTSNTEKDIEVLKKLENSIYTLGVAWKKLFEDITKAIAPFLTSVTDSLTKIADLKKNFFGLNTNSFKEFGESVIDFFTADFKKIDEKIGELQEKFLQYTTNQAPLGIDQLAPNNSSISNGGAVSITNNFEINNPPGTSDEDSLSTWQKIKNELVASFNDAFREIQNNNPVDE
jgi:TP901 family phage tail tape measure protein